MGSPGPGTPPSSRSRSIRRSRVDRIYEDMVALAMRRLSRTVQYLECFGEEASRTLAHVLLVAQVQDIAFTMMPGSSLRREDLVTTWLTRCLGGTKERGREVKRVQIMSDLHLGSLAAPLPRAQSTSYAKSRTAQSPRFAHLLRPRSLALGCKSRPSIKQSYLPVISAMTGTPECFSRSLQK
jgi:hypothetical protein